MTVSPTVAGRLMVAIAVLGLVVSVAGTAVAWVLVGDLDDSVGQSLEATGEVLATVDESFVLAEDSLAVLEQGVEDAETAVRALAGSMAEGQAALESASALAGGDVADTIESVERTLPAVETAAGAIDGTLGALSGVPFVTLPYDPEQPLGETIRELREELSGLPGELRTQAEQVERTSEGLTEATEGTEAAADSLADLQDQLEDASELVSGYAAQTGEVGDLVAEQREVLTVSARRVRFTVVAFGLVFALSQFVPLYLGFGLLGRPTAPPDVA